MLERDTIGAGGGKISSNSSDSTMKKNFTVNVKPSEMLIMNKNECKVARYAMQ